MVLRPSCYCLLTNTIQLEPYPNFSSPPSEERQVRETMGKVPEITSQQEHGIALPVFTFSHYTNLQTQSGISDEPEALPLLLPQSCIFTPEQSNLADIRFESQKRE